MKMLDAQRLMRAKGGYRVQFERREGGMLHSDCFPDRDEPPIIDLEDAWKLAAQWAALDPAVYVNVFVTYAVDGCPVENYTSRRLNKHPPAGWSPEKPWL